MATAEHTVSKVEFGQWEGLKFGGTPPSTRYVAAKKVIGALDVVVSNLRYSHCHFRYSQAATLLGETIYLFGGASSSEEATTTYHGDLFSLNCKQTSLNDCIS